MRVAGSRGSIATCLRSHVVMRRMPLSPNSVPVGAQARLKPCPSSMCALQVATTLCIPHILVPLLFIFLWQSTPNPSTALFYFQASRMWPPPSVWCAAMLCMWGDPHSPPTCHRLLAKPKQRQAQSRSGQCGNLTPWPLPVTNVLQTNVLQL